MTTMGDNACIVDTNVIVYSTVSGNPWYEQARQWLATLQSGGRSLDAAFAIFRDRLGTAAARLCSSRRPA
jgi:hypothetical protein